MTSNYFITDDNENRGIIWRKGSEKSTMICRTFPYTEEYLPDDKIINETLSQGVWKLYPSYEGTIIRLVNDQETGTHLLATHKKLDAFQSYWSSSQSFGSQFESSIENFYRSKVSDDVENVFALFLSFLPKTYHHTFLLCSNLETKVVADRDNEIFYVGSFDAKTNDYKGILPEMTDVLQNFCNSISEISLQDTDLTTYIDNINPLKQQGVIAIRQDVFDAFKIVNPIYRSLSELRGNSPSLIKRYFELYKTNSHLLDDFVMFFGHQAHVFQQWFEIFENTMHYLYFVVTERYQKGRYVQTSPFLHTIVKKFENVAKTKGVDIADIKSYLLELSADDMFGIMNSYVNFLSKIE